MSDVTHPNQAALMLTPGTLWDRLVTRTEQALQCGALLPIPTDYEVVEAEGMNFIVRVISHLARKDAAAQAQQRATVSGKPINPFLPYEPELLVTQISPTHLALLNKYNVVDHHLLIVTRAFQAQDTWLSLPDFEALWACMMEVDGFAFYNAGPLAGASQPHKHLQLLPLPFAPEGPPLPLSALIDATVLETNAGTLSSLPFVHVIVPLPLDWFHASPASAQVMFSCYQTLLAAVGWSPQVRADRPQLAGAYNLLVTRQWMLLVPRSQEHFQGIPVNALGFAGSLLARNRDQLQHLKTIGPMTVLKNVAIMPPKR
jgi:ATP adenylyltransferase